MKSGDLAGLVLFNLTVLAIALGVEMEASKSLIAYLFGFGFGLVAMYVATHITENHEKANSDVKSK